MHRSRPALAPLFTPLCLVSLGTSAPAQNWLESSVQTQLLVTSPIGKDAFGWNVASVGDVTGDGLADIAVSAPLDPTGVSGGGMVSVYSGSDGALVWIQYESLQSAILGHTLEVADWNGDGTLDVFAGAPSNGSSGGRVWVFSGDDGAVLHTFGLGVPGESFGTAIAVGGDFDGDGTDDVAVGSMGYSPAGLSRTGRISIFSGVDASLLTTVDGPHDDAEFGIGMAFVEDLSLPFDGTDELVVGHRDPSFYGGSALVYTWDGAGASLLYSVGGVGMGYNLMGDRIDGGGDLDGDGRGDFFVGDVFAGTAQVFSGVDGSLLHVLDGNGRGDAFGTGHFIPDVDGDGLADLLLGDLGDSTVSEYNGRVFLYSGATGAILRTMTYRTKKRRIGIDARWIGDQNGDGFGDYVAGGSGGSGGGPPLGRFLIVHGAEIAQHYCAAGTSANSCRTTLAGAGTASASAASGYDLTVTRVEGGRTAIFFFGTSGRQAAPWGNGSSFQCVVPPVKRTGALTASGTPGQCDGEILFDLHAHWTARPAQNPGSGALVQVQLWYRDPF